LNFVELLSDALLEKGKTWKDLENAGVICRRGFYQYKTYTPFLPSVLKIANFLEMSLDYFTNRVDKNVFKRYKIKQTLFFENLDKIMKSYNISQCQLAKDLNIGRTNFLYWKSGSLPKLITLVDLSNYLNCSIDDLLEHE